MQYEFSTDIPVTSSRASYPFKALEVGESVLYPATIAKEKLKARKAAYRLSEIKDWEIVTRSSPEGVRVWRLS